ncbi:hypothetical protein [Salinirubrum litoreum]|uniref:Uncharacterized protein n=1 Tax=Salinirubrum litoreum TaxID=1126234 RepID=A0ABD5RDX2_9EURY
MLLVVTYSQSARATLRNVCASHEAAVVRRFGRAALLADTELGAFLALRLREKHADDVQLERTEPFNEFADAPESVREAATAYENRETVSTPYAKFAVGRDHPTLEELTDEPL